MKYLKAQNVLPDEIIKIIQEYVDGEFIYVPRKDGRQKAWGEKSGARESLKNRNDQIFKQYMKGVPVMELSQTFFLSEQSIRRVISQGRASCSILRHNRS